MTPVRILVWASTFFGPRPPARRRRAGPRGPSRRPGRAVARHRALVAGLAAVLAPTAAHAHHPGGDDAGLASLWLFAGVALVLAGIAAWAFLSGGPGDADEAEDPAAEPADPGREHPSDVAR